MKNLICFGIWFCILFFGLFRKEWLEYDLGVRFALGIICGLIGMAVYCPLRKKKEKEKKENE